MSHTPGPWKHQLDNFGDGEGWQYVVVTTEPHALIATVFPSTENDDDRAVPDEGQANAAVIAAAPDLLQAAQDIAANTTTVGSEVRVNWSPGSLARLRAAIAKATGDVR